jgi:hypothetical protein
MRSAVLAYYLRPADFEHPASILRTACHLDGKFEVAFLLAKLFFVIVQKPSYRLEDEKIITVKLKYRVRLLGLS